MKNFREYAATARPFRDVPTTAEPRVLPSRLSSMAGLCVMALSPRLEFVLQDRRGLCQDTDHVRPIVGGRDA